MVEKDFQSLLSASSSCGTDGTGATTKVVRSSSSSTTLRSQRSFSAIHNNNNNNNNHSFHPASGLSAPQQQQIYPLTSHSNNNNSNINTKEYKDVSIHSDEDINRRSNESKMYSEDDTTTKRSDEGIMTMEFLEADPCDYSSRVHRIEAGTPVVRSNAILDLVYGLLVLGVGWYGPRWYLQNETILKNKVTPPVQTFALPNSDRVLVVRDPALNHPLVEPPTIPSSFLIWTSVYLPLLFVAVVAYAYHPYEEEFRKQATRYRQHHQSQPQKPLEKEEEQQPQQQKNELGTSVRRRWLKVASAVASICTAIGISEGITQCLKIMIQRKRPNFYALCQYSEQEQRCLSPNDDIIREAQLSFPSGHSSLSSCAMAFVTWFLLEKLHSYYNQYHVSTNITNNAARRRSYRCCNGLHLFPRVCWIPIGVMWQRQQNQCSVCSSMMCCSSLQQYRYCSILICLLFPGWSVYVGATRLVDTWHHPSDVVAGLLLGSTIGTMVYRIWTMTSNFNSQECGDLMGCYAGSSVSNNPPVSPLVSCEKYDIQKQQQQTSSSFTSSNLNNSQHDDIETNAMLARSVKATGNNGGDGLTKNRTSFSAFV